ncbi:MDR family oxidoreductase [Aneurinibacillus terranovensis]|uniref:acrylyl-CoA reductase (NADPH) n=1 Tax=Aneurinibacillus terranovensis TaxID=278991 RepID=UPI00040CC182|nr:MDR family oxidoreductase [Aneurinibacillus terranovensis]
MDQLVKALVLDNTDGKQQASIKELRKSDFPEGEVDVQILYSSLNYKDGLAITGKGKIVRSFPFVPGIDFVGVVEDSRSPRYKKGDKVILTGWGVGERYWGGYSQFARVKAEWLVPLPESLSPEWAMSIGTAGLTAILSVLALEKHGVQPNGREVVVTGASGGVGSMAVAILAKRGYKVVASTGRTETHDYLRSLGASDIIDRQVLASPGKPLESERWGGAIDTVGGTTLAGVLRSTAYGGSVAACGLAGGNELPTTVFPFILRGVNLLGIDSVNSPFEMRQEVWKLAAELPAEIYEQVTRIVPLQALFSLSEEILKGQVRGRIVVDVNA